MKEEQKQSQELTIGLDVFIKTKNDFVDMIRQEMSYESAKSYISVMESFYCFIYKELFLPQFDEWTPIDQMQSVVIKSNSLSVFLEEKSTVTKSLYSEKLYVSILRRFFLYLLERGYPAKRLLNYFKEYRRYRLPDFKIQELDIDDIEAIRQELDKLKSSPKKRFQANRNALMFKLALLGGGRPDELKRIRLNYIKENKLSYSVLFESDKAQAREVKILKAEITNEVKVLSEYLEPNDNVAVSRNKRLLSNFEISNWLHSAMRKAGVRQGGVEKGKRSGFYLLRHSYGMSLARKGLNVDTIRRKMGFKKSSSAKLYIDALEK